MNRIFAITAAVVLINCCNSRQDNLKDNKSDYVPEVNKVEIITLKKTDFFRQLLSNGKISASRRAELSFGTSGTINGIYFQNGDRVSEGDVIARLDTRELENASRQAMINMQKAELDLYDVLAGLGYQAGDTVSIPKEVLTMAKTRSGFSAAENAVRKAGLLLDGSEIRAPFSGLVAGIESREYGQSPSKAFCTILDNNVLYVDFTVMESEYSFVGPGLNVKVSSFAAPSRFLNGKILYVNPLVDKNGQISVRARISNDGSMVDGMNAKVIVERTVPGQFVVPKSAVVIRDYKNVLFTYTDDGKAHWTYVDILWSNSDSHVVRANADRASVLSENDKVIVSGNLNLADGSEVELKK